MQNIIHLALARLEHYPVHQKAVGSVPSQDTYLDCMFDPPIWCVQKASLSLPLFLSPSPSLCLCLCLSSSPLTNENKMHLKNIIYLIAKYSYLPGENPEQFSVSLAMERILS